MNDQQKNIEEKEGMNPWEAWIIDHGGPKEELVLGKSSYDKLLEMAVDSYSLLTTNNRKQELKDQQQYLCTWWYENRSFFRKYTSYAKVGELLGGKDHATIMHSIHKRKKSLDYEMNIECIKDFLES